MFNWFFNIVKQAAKKQKTNKEQTQDTEKSGKHEGKLAVNIVPEALDKYFNAVSNKESLYEPAMPGFDLLTRKDIADSAIELDNNPLALNRPDYSTLRLTLSNIYGENNTEEIESQLLFAVRAALYDYIGRTAYEDIIKSSLTKELGEKEANKIFGTQKKSLEDLSDRVNIATKDSDKPVLSEIQKTLNDAVQLNKSYDTNELTAHDLLLKDPKLPAKLAEKITTDNPKVNEYNNAKNKLQHMFIELFNGKHVKGYDEEDVALVNIATDAVNNLVEKANDPVYDKLNELKLSLGEVMLKAFKAASSDKAFLTINNLIKDVVNNKDESTLSDVVKQYTHSDSEDEANMEDNEFYGEDDTLDLAENKVEPGISTGEAREKIKEALLTKKDNQYIIGNPILRMALYLYLTKNNTGYTFKGDASSVEADSLTDEEIDKIINKVEPYLGETYANELKKYKQNRSEFANIYNNTKINSNKFNPIFNKHIKEAEAGKNGNENRVVLEELAAEAVKHLIGDTEVDGNEINSLQTDLRQLLAVANKSTFSPTGAGTLLNRLYAESARKYKYLKSLEATLATSDPEKIKESGDIEKAKNLQLKSVELAIHVSDILANIGASASKAKTYRQKQNVNAAAEHFSKIYHGAEDIWNAMAKLISDNKSTFTQAVQTALSNSKEGDKSEFNTELDFLNAHSKLADALKIVRKKSTNNEGESSSNYELAKSMLSILDEVKSEYTQNVKESNAINKLRLPEKELLKDRVRKVQNYKAQEDKKESGNQKTVLMDIAKYLIDKLGPSSKIKVAQTIRQWAGKGKPEGSLFEVISKNFNEDELKNINKEELEQKEYAYLQPARANQEGRYITTGILKALDALYTDQNIQLEQVGLGSVQPYKSENKSDNQFELRAQPWTIKIQETILNNLYAEYKHVKSDIAESKNEKVVAAYKNLVENDEVVQNVETYVDHPQSILLTFKEQNSGTERDNYLQALYKGLAHIYNATNGLKDEALDEHKTTPFNTVCKNVTPGTKTVQNPVLSASFALDKIIDETPFSHAGAVLVNEIEDLSETLNTKQKKHEEKSEGLTDMKDMEVYPVFPEGLLTFSESGSYLYTPKSELPKNRTELKPFSEEDRSLVLDPILLNPEFVSHPEVKNDPDYTYDLMFDQERHLLFAVKYEGDLVPADADGSTYEFDPKASGEIVSCLGPYSLDQNNKKGEPEEQEEQSESTENEEYKPTDDENNIAKEQGFSFSGLNKQAADEELPYTPNTFEESQSEGIAYNPGAEKSMTNEETEKHFSMSKLGQLIKNALRTDPDFFKTVENIVRQSEIPNPEDVITFLQCLIKAGGEATPAIRLYNAQASEPKERSYFWHLIKTHVWPILRKDSTIKGIAEQLNDKDVIE